MRSEGVLKHLQFVESFVGKIERLYFAFHVGESGLGVPVEAEWQEGYRCMRYMTAMRAASSWVSL